MRNSDQRRNILDFSCPNLPNEDSYREGSENDAEGGENDGYKCECCVELHVLDG